MAGDVRNTNQPTPLSAADRNGKRRPGDDMGLRGNPHRLLGVYTDARFPGEAVPSSPVSLLRGNHAAKGGKS